MSDLDDQTPASPSESILLAAQAVPTTVPIIATVVPAPTASQELEEIRVAESLMSLREGPSTAQRSYALEIISETQYSDLEVVLPHVGVGCGYLPYTSVDPNSTTLPVQSTPGIDSHVIGLSRVYTSATCCAATSCADEQHVAGNKQQVARNKLLVACSRAAKFSCRECG